MVDHIGTPNDQPSVFLWSRQITAQEKGMNCSSVCFTEAFLVGKICLLLELCCSFSLSFGILLRCPKPAWHYLNIYKILEVTDCTFASLRSLWNYIPKMQVLLWSSLELQGSQDKWHCCTTAVVPPLQQPQVLSQDTWERAQRLCLLAVSRGFVKWNTCC